MEQNFVYTLEKQKTQQKPQETNFQALLGGKITHFGGKNYFGRMEVIIDYLGVAVVLCVMLLDISYQGCKWMSQ